jgi:hypothetical protein
MTRGSHSMVVVYVFTWTTFPADFCGPASDERSRRLYKRLSTADRPDRI